MKDSSYHRTALFVAAFLLLTAVLLVAYGSWRESKPRFTARLVDLMPSPPRGWVLKEKPIAESAEMQEAVGELLNFDDGIFYDYISPTGDRLSVYLAYWSPGRMSHRLVAGHTPDVCWSGSGWRKTQSGDTSEVLPALPVGEARIFEAKDTPEYVWFWHLVGAESKRYGTGFAPPWYSPVTDLFRKGLNQREEQFFIRISSNKPLDTFLANGPLPELLSRIPWPKP